MEKRLFFSTPFYSRIIMLLALGFIFYSYGYSAKSEGEESWTEFLLTGQRQKIVGEYEEALKNFERAIALAKKSGDREGALEAMKNKGITLWNLGRMKEASEAFSEGCSFAAESGYVYQKAFLENCLEVYQLYQQGKERREKLDLKGAINCFQKAINLAEKARSYELELKCLRQVSVAFYEQNAMEEFYHLNERALRIARLLNHKLEEGRCLNNIAIFELKSGELIKAWNKFNEAVSVIQKYGTKKDNADCINNLGLIFLEMGFYERALDYFKRVLMIDNELGDYDNAIIDYNHIAISLRNKGKFIKNNQYIYDSIEYLNEAVKLAAKKNNKNKIISLNNLGISLSLIEEKERAINCLNEALRLCTELKDIINLIHVCDSLASIYAEDMPEKAIIYLNKALKYLPKANDHDLSWPIYYNLGRCYEKLNNINAAIENYKKSIGIIEEARKKIEHDFYQAGFLRNKEEVFEAMIRMREKIYNLDPNENNKEELFLAVEKAKAKSFVESLEKSLMKNNRELPEHVKEKEEKLNRELSRDMLSLSTAKQLKEGMDRSVDEFEFIRKEDSYLTLMAEAKSGKDEGENELEEERIQLKKIQENILDDTTAIIEFYFGEKRSIAILITKNDYKYFFMPPRKDVEESILGYVKYLSHPPLSNINGALAARRIYQELFEPLEKLIPENVENLIIIPDGYLYYLPFESLVTHVDQKKEHPQYLINKYNISYAPSVSSLGAWKKKNRNNDKKKVLLAVGYPKYDLFFNSESPDRKKLSYFRYSFFKTDFQFLPLPYTRTEINKIVANFDKKMRDVYLKEKASEGVIKKLPLDQYKIIHFACHGFVDENYPFRSALVLTPEPKQGEDGFLQAREIFNLNLDADLVVLSSCQSAKGPLERGEGILGLNRVFFTCGARNVLSSLWAINDRSTAELMGYFYKYLIEGYGIAKALKLAKIDMLHTRYKHPFYWAGFILYGDSLVSLFPSSVH